MRRGDFINSLTLAGLFFKSNVLGLHFFIREKLNRIVKIDISDESLEGGEISCFMEDDSILRVNVDQYGEYWQYHSEILLAKENSIHKATETIYKYRAQFELENATVIENVFYFVNDKIYHHKTSSEKEIDLAKSQRQFHDRLHFVLTRLRKPRLT